MLRHARESAGLSRELLADRTGRTAESVIRWESGKTRPHPGTITRIEHILGASLREGPK